MSIETLSPPRPVRKTGYRDVFVKTAITVGLLGFLLSRVNLRATVLEILSVSPAVFVLNVALMVALSALSSARWQIILKAMKHPLRFGRCWRLVMIGSFFNQTLPSSIGGDAVRVWLCAGKGMPLRYSFVGVLLDRVFGLIGLGVCVAIGLPLLIAGPAAKLAIWVSLLVLLGAVGLLGFDMLAERLAPLASRMAGKTVAKFAALPLGLLRDTSRMFAATISRPAIGAAVIGISVANQISLGAVAYILARALGAALTVGDALVMLPLAILLTMVPISLGGWGIREAAMVWLLGTVGIPPQEALGISILFGLATAAAGLPGGIVWLFERRSKSGYGDLASASSSLEADGATSSELISRTSSKLSQ